MPAIVAKMEMRWPGRVPFEIGNLQSNEPGGITAAYLLERIEHFNKRCAHEVFAPRVLENDYVLFEYGGSSDEIGRRGGMQKCRVKASNLFHEMGHTIGLAHTYSHQACRLH